MIESIDWTQVILALVSAVLVPVVSNRRCSVQHLDESKGEQVKEQIQQRYT